MTADFRAALDDLESLQGDIGRPLIERFTCAEAADVAWFRERFPLLSEPLRGATIAAMMENAEIDFELDFADLFRVALDDVSPAVRKMAIEGLWEDERLELMRRLLALLEGDPAEEVRAAAAVSLGRYVYMAECEDLDSTRAERVRSALERAVNDGTLEVARRALESLAYINDEQVTRLIDAAYAHSHPLMRQSALFAMGRSADRFWAETVLAELHSDEPAMRYEAARASGEMRLPRALPALARLIAQDRDAEVKTVAIWAMGEIGGKRARQLLEQLVESDDEVQTAAAEEALERMDLASREFDLLVFEPEDETSVIRHHAQPEAEIVPVVDGDEDEPEAEEEGGTTPDYRRQFERYTDEDDDSDEPDESEDEWPDELIELT
jgi:HEAT repeat protein